MPEIIEKWGRKWICINGVFSLYEPDDLERKKKLKIGIRENSENLLKQMSLMSRIFSP